MRAPDQDTGRATIDDLAVTIADVLKPWREHGWQDERRRYHQAEVSAAVLKQIKLLRAVVPEHFTREAVRKTRDDARDLVKTIKKLERQLNRIKWHSPELRIRLGLSEPFLAELARLCDVCEEADQAAGKEDRCKRQCIQTAGHLIYVYSED